MTSPRDDAGAEADRLALVVVNFASSSLLAANLVDPGLRSVIGRVVVVDNPSTIEETRRVRELCVANDWDPGGAPAERGLRRGSECRRRPCPRTRVHAGARTQSRRDDRSRLGPDAPRREQGGPARARRSAHRPDRCDGLVRGCGARPRDRHHSTCTRRTSSRAIRRGRPEPASWRRSRCGTRSAGSTTTTSCTGRTSTCHGAGVKPAGGWSSSRTRPPFMMPAAPKPVPANPPCTSTSTAGTGCCSPASGSPRDSGDDGGGAASATAGASPREEAGGCWRSIRCCSGRRSGERSPARSGASLHGARSARR